MSNYDYSGKPPVVAGSDERTWAMLCHLSAFAGYVVPIPFANIVGPLVVWLIKKDQYPLVDDQGKESLNFQISMCIWSLLAALLILVVVGLFLLIGLIIFGIVVTIIAAVQANAGVCYRYPLTIRFLR